MIAFLAPLLLVSGASLLNKDLRSFRNFVVAAGTSAILFFSGLGLSIYSAQSGMASNTLLNWNYVYTVSEDFRECKNLAECNITLTEDHPYNFDVNASANDTDITFNIYNEENEIVFTKTAAGLLSVSEDLKLQPGIYKMEFNSGNDIIGKEFRYKAVVSNT